MNKHAQEKEAFKLGFILAMAQEKIGASELVDACTMAVEKTAKKGDKGGGGGGSPFTGLAGAATGLGALGFGGAIGVPSLVGSTAGIALGDAVNSEYDTVRQAKKRFLIKKYKNLLRQVQNQQDNELISQTLQEGE